MAYRNGVHVAFNGCGTTDPTMSDIKYFNLLKGWNANNSIDFSFSNSHEKTSQVRDSSLRETLLKRLRERMANSKVMMVIITENSSQNRGLLNWEIEKCVDTYGLPVIAAYTGITGSFDPWCYQRYWPEALAVRIASDTVRSIHIPFKREPILAACAAYKPVRQPMSRVTVYKAETYRKWGLS